MRELSAEICNELIAEIDKVPFRGFRIGLLMSDYIFLDLHRLPKTRTPQEWLIDKLRCFKSIFTNPGTTGGSGVLGYKKSLFLYQSGRQDLLNFTKPVVERIGYENVIIYGVSTDVHKEWPPSATVIDSKMLPCIDKFLWWREFLKCAPLWNKSFSSFERKYHLKPLMPLLSLGLVKATQQLMRADSYLKLMQPDILVTDFDRSSQIAPFIAAGNALGIPTVTMIHNVPGSHPSFGIFPTIAKHVCCWGEIMFNDAREHQEPLSKLQILGNQNFMGKEYSNRHQRKNCSSDRDVITLALSPFREDVTKEIIEVFVNAVSKMERIYGVIRLHPYHNLSDFVRYDTPNITISPNHGISKIRLINESRVIVGHETSFLTDSILLGTPVVILDILDRPLKLGGKLALYSDMPIAKSSVQLREALERILNDKNYRKALNSGALRYHKALNYAEGNVAADNVCEFIKSLTRDTSYANID